MKVVVLLCALIAGAPVSAQTVVKGDQQAKAWFVNGQDLYENGEYAKALMAFDMAFRLSGRPNVLRSIAYCHENLGKLEKAIDVLYQYRGVAEPSKFSEIDQHILRLE
jgi:tetratricopeptide (TPR) repeat protein